MPSGPWYSVLVMAAPIIEPMFDWEYNEEKNCSGENHCRPSEK